MNCWATWTMNPMAMADPLYPLLALSRLRMNVDGDGVTTLVAGAGCPLRCRWCINKKLLAESRLELVSAEELVERLRIDDLYFRATGGGVCFGGGEALLHAPFLRAFRAVCPKEWRIWAETSLHVPAEQLRLSLGAVDEYIVDCKDMNREIYRRYTGGDGSLMEANLRLLLAAVGPERVLVRVPLIPGYNGPEDQRRSVDALKAMGVTRLDCFSYVVREEDAAATSPQTAGIPI